MSIHVLASSHVSTYGVSPSYYYSSPSFYVTCWIVVHASTHRPGRSSGVDHTNVGDGRTIILTSSFVLSHNVTCYTNFIVSRIHVNTTKLRNTTCTLVATGVILRSLECMLGTLKLSPPKAHKSPTWLKLHCEREQSNAHVRKYKSQCHVQNSLWPYPYRQTVCNPLRYLVDHYIGT